MSEKVENEMNMGYVMSNDSRTRITIMTSIIMTAGIMALSFRSVFVCIRMEATVAVSSMREWNGWHETKQTQ